MYRIIVTWKWKRVFYKTMLPFKDHDELPRSRVVPFGRAMPEESQSKRGPEWNQASFLQIRFTSGGKIGVTMLT